MCPATLPVVCPTTLRIVTGFSGWLILRKIRRDYLPVFVYEVTIVCNARAKRWEVPFKALGSLPFVHHANYPACFQDIREQLDSLPIDPHFLGYAVVTQKARTEAVVLNAADSFVSVNKILHQKIKINDITYFGLTLHIA